MLSEQIFTGYVKCPIGIIEIKAFADALFAVKILSEDSIINFEDSKEVEIIEIAKMQLQEYFNKVRKNFDLPLNYIGTEFQQKVWREVEQVPFGKTKSYGQLAIELGKKELTRAVGAANGKNPLWIIVPCHRIVGRNNELVGYAGGLWRKQWLLEHEGVQSRLF